MKPTYIFTLATLAVLLITACGPETPTSAPPVQPTATQALVPTEAPETSGDPVWDRIQAAGKIEFGTSADYRPFEYYDADYDIVGFDAALARGIGTYLGLDIELVDIAFEGLPAALQVGQIDAAIAAISITSEREAALDFSNVYYSGQDMVLARQGSGIQPLAAAAQLAQYRVGVQRGSVYETWIQQTLIATGLMPQANLLQYAKATDALRDLRESRNDLVVLDRLPAEEYILAGGVVPVAQNLNTQLYAIALPQGSSVLQARVNEALTALQNDGSIARLTETYLDIELPAAAPTPVPTPTAVPGPTATPVACVDSMEFVRDVQTPDGTEMRPGQDFDKVWRIRNSGTCNWTQEYKIMFVQGDRMEGTSENVKGEVRPGDTYDMIIDQVAPREAGKYTGIWQMVNPKGTPFGERIWIKISVPGAPGPTATPQPTATPVPTAQPTQPPAPVIDFLNVSDATVEQGGTLTIEWSFSGQALLSARLNRTNPDGSISVLNGGADVAQLGQLDDTPSSPGNYTYSLNVTSESGTTVKTAVVNVTPALPVPGSEIQGVEWRLSSFVNPVKPDEDLTPIGGTELTIIFNSDGTATGSTGCNTFNTTYTVSGTGVIDIADQILSGGALCDEAVNGQETLYLDLLKSVDGYEVSGKELVLKAPDPAQAGEFNVLSYKEK